jgi:hypothetical protein
MNEDRRYSDREVERLLARAVELSRESEARASGEPDRQEGMSLAELEKAAAEAGLPVETLRRAAWELDSGLSSAGGRGVATEGKGLAARLFGPLRLREERVIGRPPTEAELANLALVLPDLAGVPGSVVQGGGGLIFRSDGGYETQYGQRLRFEVRPDGRLIVERSFGGAAGGVYGGLVGGVGLGGGLGVGFGVGLGSLHSGLFAAAFAIGALLLSCLASRGIMAAIVADARRKNARILEDASARFSAVEPGKGLSRLA